MTICEINDNAVDGCSISRENSMFYESFASMMENSFYIVTFILLFCMSARWLLLSVKLYALIIDDRVNKRSKTFGRNTKIKDYDFL